MVLLWLGLFFGIFGCNESVAGWCDLSLHGGEKLAKQYAELYEAGYGAQGIPVLDEAVIFHRGASVNFRGKTNHGVVEVETAFGPAVLKFFPPEMSLEKNHVSLSLQKLLGDLGIAPAVLGVIPPRPGHENGGPALLMKKAPGVLVKRETPRSIKYYGKAGLTRAAAHQAAQSIRLFEQLLNSLSIYGEDVQFLMTEDGQVSVFDFDFYSWRSPAGEVRSLFLDRAQWLIQRTTMPPNDFTYLADYLENLGQ